MTLVSHDESPPSYDVAMSNGYVQAFTASRDDGRVDVTIQAKQQGLADLLRAGIQEDKQETLEAYPVDVVALNIVIQIVGSRGDVQPFIALGTQLQREGHRVRLATHENFNEFVRQAGLEFYSIGGNPEELMSFMVNNPGIIPKTSTIVSGEIGRKRQMIEEMLHGCWRSCVEPDLITNTPFVADVIIANPPSFAHVHCAQALGVPLHIMFTMPWSPTREFPHPLANIRSSSMDPSVNNYLSYSMVELLTWSGLADIINKFRLETLNLEELSTRTAIRLMETLKIPHTYCWSPALIKKPSDWPLHIDVCGFFFREEPSYEPPKDILQFLSNGPAPVYIGFGSIVMDDPVAMTSIIAETCSRLGIRAIVSKGWSKLGHNCHAPNILFIDDCPHEWLFKRVAAVVHHGGAGTTACGLLNGCPTTIVPFFGDQPFWATMVAAAGAGPLPLDHKRLTATALADAISYCLTPQANQAASKISAMMKAEDGVTNAVTSFHRHLPWKDLRCDFLPSEVAVWSFGRKGIKISHKAMLILTGQGKLDIQGVKPYRSNKLHIEKPLTDPLSSTSGVLINTTARFTKGLGNLAIDPVKGTRQMTSSLVNGALVETPIALAEGLRNVPRLYGDAPEKSVPIEDWKEGVTQAGKQLGCDKLDALLTRHVLMTGDQGLYTGFADGLSGFITKPYREAKKDGAAGFAKGFAKGSIELFVKPGAAMFGLMAYPAMGIYKSLKNRNLNPTEAKILESKIALGNYLFQRSPPNPEEVKMVLSTFDRLS